MNYLKFSEIIGFNREYSRFKERLTTIKDLKDNHLKNGTILDVGSGLNYKILREYFGDRFYGVDFVGDYIQREELFDGNFIECNLNNNKLPFEDNHFDNVICTDVLEHLNSPHDMIKEIFRVSKKNVIISLPNNWNTFYYEILLGYEFAPKIGYGLPENKPQPGRRHTFFFNFEHACKFLDRNKPSNFDVFKRRFIFERKSDGLISMIPIFSSIFNRFGKLEISILREKLIPNKFLSTLVYITVKIIYFFISFVNNFLTVILYGFPKKRFYNLFCRQVWYIYRSK